MLRKSKMSPKGAKSSCRGNLSSLLQMVTSENPKPVTMMTSPTALIPIDRDFQSLFGTSVVQPAYKTMTTMES